MPNDQQKDSKGPAVRFPPPLIFIAFLALGYAIDTQLPLSLGIPVIGKYLGTALVLLCFLALIQLLLSYLKAHTSIEPWKPTCQLITSGLYRYSRNPIYTAFCLINIGIGLYMNSLWLMLSFLPSAYTIYLIAIRKEERYLEAKFGDQYRRYKNSVRRWL